MASTPQKDAAFERGLPSNVYAERMVLGSVLMNDEKFVNVAATLQPDDFSLDKHRRIFRRMLELYDRQEKIDHVTLSNELMRYGELESVDGVSYLVSLDEGPVSYTHLDVYKRQALPFSLTSAVWKTDSNSMWTSALAASAGARNVRR